MWGYGCVCVCSTIFAQASTSQLVMERDFFKKSWDLEAVSTGLCAILEDV
jgi:hypothetical protein